VLSTTIFRGFYVNQFQAGKCPIICELLQEPPDGQGDKKNKSEQTWSGKTDKGISMDEAVKKGVDYVGDKGELKTTGNGKNFQMQSKEGNVVKNARFNVTNLKPSEEPHLNIQKYINRIQVENEHIKINPDTIKAGDMP